MVTFWGLMLIGLSGVTFAKIPDPEYLDMLRATGQDKKFADLMGIQDTSLVRENSERTDNPMFSNVSELGDILLTPEQSEQARNGLNFAKWSGNKWQNNVIPYWVSRSDFSEDQRKMIDDSISVLSNNLQTLKLREWQSGDTDYVFVISGSGCWSYIGKTGNSQYLSLQANGCLWTKTVQHEFMHAAGLNHEQSRPDRDHYVRLLWDNIPQEWQSQYQKGNYGDYGLYSDYDYYSVMHYGMNAPGTGKPAFEFYDKGVDTNRIGDGENNGPTKLDYQKLNNMYF